MEYEISNAIIETATIKIERGTFLDCSLHVNYGGSGQGFGGFVLYKKDESDWKIGANYAGRFISRCMEIADVEDWDRMNGKTIRVKREAGWNGKIVAIGHIVKDDWFNPSEEFK